MAGFTIVWTPLKQEIIDNWGLPLSEGVSVPFFLEGDASNQLQSERGAPLLPFDLLRGILVAYRNDPPVVALAASRRAMPAVVEHLGRGFGRASLEATVLDVAVKMRDEYGNDLSRVVLETGTALAPESSKIRSDLVADLWILAEKAPEDDLRPLLDEIAAHVPQIDVDDIHAGAAELVCYAHFVALHYLGRDAERDRFLQQVIFQRVSHPAYKKRIRYLVEGNPFDMERLRFASTTE
jgi:hypothetical protein